MSNFEPPPPPSGAGGPLPPSPPPAGQYAVPPVDAKTAKANAKAEKARAKALRPWYKKKRFIIPIAFVGLAAISAAAGGGGDDNENSTASGGSTRTTAAQAGASGSDSGVDTESNNDEHAPPDDINSDFACTTDEAGFATATGTLTNHSSGESSYIIEVRYTDEGGTQYATGTAFVNNVAPGSTAEWDANSLTESRSGSCEITDVNRFAS